MFDSARQPPPSFRPAAAAPTSPPSRRILSSLCAPLPRIVVDHSSPQASADGVRASRAGDGTTADIARPRPSGTPPTPVTIQDLEVVLTSPIFFQFIDRPEMIRSFSIYVFPKYPRAPSWNSPLHLPPMSDIRIRPKSASQPHPPPPRRSPPSAARVGTRPRLLPLPASLQPPRPQSPTPPPEREGERGGARREQNQSLTGCSSIGVLWPDLLSSTPDLTGPDRSTRHPRSRGLR